MAVSTGAEPRLVSDLRLVLMRIARRLRQQSQGDVTPSMLSALSTVELHGPITLGALAAHERIQPPTMTLVVGRLCDAGLVTRQVDPADRRISRLTISSEGKKFLANSRSRKDAYLAGRIKRLSPDELEALRAAVPVLQKLLAEDDTR